MKLVYRDAFGPARRQRGSRRPTLASVAKQAAKAGIDVARFEVDASGKIIIVPRGQADEGEARDARDVVKDRIEAMRAGGGRVLKWPK